MYPPDLTLSAADKITVFAFIPGKDPVTVTVNGINRVNLEGEDFRTAEVPLSPGMNILNIGGKQVRVYDAPKSKMKEFAYSSPRGALTFRSYRLHPALDDGCTGCHGVKDAKLTTKPLKDACYGCHDDFEKADDGKKVFVHPPVAAGECTACHEPHFSALPKLQKSAKGCYGCHDPFPDTGDVHSPVKEGECTGCHSPHAGPAPEQLRRPGNALCLGCHENPHTQHRTTEIKGTLTQIPPDFPTEGDQLSCLGCHRPHQSPERRLFRKSQGALCQTCHRV